MTTRKCLMKFPPTPTLFVSHKQQERRARQFRVGWITNVSNGQQGTNINTIKTSKSSAHKRQGITSPRFPCRRRNEDSKGVLSTWLGKEGSVLCARIVLGWQPCSRKRSTSLVHSVDGSMTFLLRGEHSRSELRRANQPTVSSLPPGLAQRLGP